MAAHQLEGKRRCAVAAEEAARVAWACGVLRMGLTPKVSGAGRSAATEGHQQGPRQWRSLGPCWRPLDRPVRLVVRRHSGLKGAAGRLFAEHSNVRPLPSQRLWL